MTSRFVIFADVPLLFTPFFNVVCIVQGGFVILTWFGVTDGTCLNNEKLNTVFCQPGYSNVTLAQRENQKGYL